MQYQAMMKLPIVGAENFFWGEALWLNRWQLYALPSPSIEQNIIELAQRLELVRSFLGAPLRITSWFRPHPYNDFIGGAQRSQHMLGRAVDFVVFDTESDKVRTLLYPKLAEFNLRMENMPGASWVHVDMACTENMPLTQRFFTP